MSRELGFDTIYTILDDAPRVPWEHLAIGLIIPLIVLLVAWRKKQRVTALLVLVWALVWNVALVPTTAECLYHERHGTFAPTLDLLAREGLIDPLFVGGWRHARIVASSKKAFVAVLEPVVDGQACRWRYFVDETDVIRRAQGATPTAQSEPIGG